uniref:Uncharacterized protein n=1 Tax=Streptomyces sp. F12 TaxID=1436084 RepID=V9Z3W6_9ACTN|nr:hypothetical protein [Streptomyces sp. F12]AHE40180.1 Hypothetical protein pFRL6_93 [Streptomyces sp. F12]
MRTSHTFSRHWDLEMRQHELLGIDLGEGIPRTTLRYGAVIFPLWWGTWLMLFGLPPRPLFPLFLLPPLGLTYYGAKRSLIYWRRTNLLVWAVRAQYLLRGVAPLIGRGRIPHGRLGIRLRCRRLGERAPQLAQMPGLSSLFTSEGPDPARSAGEALHLTPRPRLYGPDAVAKARRRTRRIRRFAPKEPR